MNLHDLVYLSREDLIPTLRGTRRPVFFLGTMNLKSRNLYGGAIVCPVKDTFADASEFRQIPDNQEVFVDTETQQSLVVELLEQVEAENEAIPTYHFQQLAEDNEAIAAEIDRVELRDPVLATPMLPPNTIVYVLQGKQQIAKFNESKVQASNTVEMVLAVVRLTQVQTDLVISINAPVAVASQSSEAIDVSPPVTLTDVHNEMDALLRELQIKDWQLFG
ncbi:hypothetical protein BCR43DRAFT_482893 [Syncephalastrum racemosum]|uniref:Ran guanine nucleotide release factor n=1 Tax=Syncephalastrum racemosum TaxID=13706 RepID=A0A1X2HUJ2_SYNRA|nr:hypothetical protein BCR43DRAFT_482893 [Syncephalastrum racemosum]